MVKIFTKEEGWFFYEEGDAITSKVFPDAELMGSLVLPIYKETREVVQKFLDNLNSLSIPSQYHERERNVWRTYPF